MTFMPAHKLLYKDIDHLWKRLTRLLHPFIEMVGKQSSPLMETLLRQSSPRSRSVTNQ